MMEVENHRILAAQEPLQNLAETGLDGTDALHLMDIIGAVEERLERLSAVQQNLADRDDLSPEEAQNEWEQVISDTSEIDEAPLPREAFEGVDGVEAGDLLPVRWMLADE